MTGPTDPMNSEFEEQLRQILKAEADSVAPGGEGLQLIRERTDRHRGTSWFGLPWLRPALALAGAGLIAASVVMSTPQVRDQVLNIVPAGANREGAPPEDDIDGPGLAAPDPTTDSDTAPAAPPDDPAEEPSPSPTEEETDPAEEGVGTATTCAPSHDDAPPSATTDAEKETGTESEPEEEQEECDPTEEPSEGDGGEDSDTDPDTEPGTGGEEPAPDDDSTGSEDGDSTSSDGEGTTSTKSSEE
ncbi:hypothetical protein [Nocardiopsis sp. NRRL B-16309]|uniref:hypothetical protein n=1 Tax=Nocardiopsis sp. NRRL B-16309 TaxID=1519494 RepID=UPI0006AF9550|nr:hypothetical protein [Nocardiopsis sp. NRRL B-16309]KOX24085.1 hypothetical protein ADL05_00260 [Nocardiopsis sp. NRRL B-16309]